MHGGDPGKRTYYVSSPPNVLGKKGRDRTTEVGGERTHDGNTGRSKQRNRPFIRDPINYDHDR